MILESPCYDDDAIYTSVEPRVDVTAEKIASVLALLRSSPGTFLTAKVIAETVGLPVRGTQVEVRKAVTILLEQQDEPIVSTVKGFAYATCSNMFGHYLIELEHRQQGLNRRIGAVRRKYLIMAHHEGGGPLAY